jgi:ABC-2 type transport system permease protein
VNKIFTVIRKEYLERVRSKSFLIGTILGPALMSLVILLPVLLSESGGEEQRTIGVIDPSGSYFERLREALHQLEIDYIDLVPVNGHERSLQDRVEDLKDRILTDKVHSGILITADFIDSCEVTFYNKSVSSLVVRDESLRPALNRVLRDERFALAGVPDSLYSYLLARSDWTSIAVTGEGEEEIQDETVSFVMAFVLILIIYIMVIMYGSHTLTAVIEEKGSRMVEVLLASISPGKLMLGKVLGIGLAGLTQFTIWAAAFFLLSRQGVSVGDFTLDVGFLTPTILLSFILFFLLGFFLYATLYAGIGAMCNSVQDSQQFHTPLAMGLVLPMMLLSFILRSPDATASVVLSLIPLFSPVLMFMRVCVQTPPWWQIVTAWLLLMVSIWLAARAAGKLFRVGILMYGAAPTWGSLVRALRS